MSDREMSSESPPIHASQKPSTRPVKPHRILACLLCQQRKVVGQRRRRFPERELLNRLRQYEALLRSHDIPFEPLHHSSSSKEEAAINLQDNDPQGARIQKQDPNNAVKYDRASQCAQRSKTSLTLYGSVWNAINDKPQENDDRSSVSSNDGVHDTVVKTAWNEFFPQNDHLFFGASSHLTDLGDLHPDQVQIFRLWQTYIDNVNPLFKVIHVPTMQTRMIDAAGKLNEVRAPLAALMFGIYCLAIVSMTNEECQANFSSPRDELLTRYQFGCHQSLLQAGFLRSDSIDSLTAFFMYLVSIRTSTDPKSLSSMLAIALRVAQRMSLHSQLASTQYTVLEAEMRRRLWWSMVHFDTRMNEMAGYQTSILAPTWNCATPLNVNDYELQPEMREVPAAQEKSTEAIFVVCRAAIGDFVRNCTFHLDFVNPVLKGLAKYPLMGQKTGASELESLSKMVEEKYLRHCNVENPLHLMTIWTTRAHLAKMYLYEHYARVTRSASTQTEAQRDAALEQALLMIEAENVLRKSPLVKGYLWYSQIHYPFLAYVHVIQDLERRPTHRTAERAWHIMSENHEISFNLPGFHTGPFYKMFYKIVNRAWRQYENLPDASKIGMKTPDIVVSMRKRIETTPQESSPESAMDNFAQPLDFRLDEPLETPWGSIEYTPSYPTRAQGLSGFASSLTDDLPVYMPPDTNLDEIDWNTMGWNPMQGMN